MRLTPLAKGLITLVLVGGIGMVIYRNQDQIPGLRKATPQSETGGPGPATAGKTGRRRIVVGVNDFGGAYPGVVANDGATPGAALDVHRGRASTSRSSWSAARRSGWQPFDDGEVDVMLLTLDYFANLAADLSRKGRRP